MPLSTPHPRRSIPCRPPSSAGTVGRSLLQALGALAVLAAVAPTASQAQQFGVDDAGLTAFPACQVEAWRGETETRIEPACKLIPNLEITLGVGFDSELRDRVREYTLEFKTALLRPRTGGVGVSLVAALDYDPRLDDASGEISGVFAYVPVTLSLGDDRLLLHANAGWRYAVADDGNGSSGREHTPILGVRADLEIPGLDERFALVGDLLSDDGDRPEFQLGLRTRVIPDRLIVDLSWGGHTARGERGKGWIVGFGWTPPTLN
jgi:hypothetical protein